jgi:hypothetical protein
MEHATRVQRTDTHMLEQIQAPSEDGRKVQMMMSLATAAFGVTTSATSGLLTSGAALGVALALAGTAGAIWAAHSQPRLD